MKRREVYVDFDDVLCETIQALLEILEQEFGKRVGYEEIRSFDLGRSFNLSAHEVKQLLDLFHQPHYLDSIEPVPGAVETIALLARSGFAVSIVTGRPPASHEASIAWLQKHGVAYTDCIFVDKYSRYDHAEANDYQVLSLEELTQKRYAFAVEDSAEMAALISGKMETPVLLLDRPWNRSIAHRSDGKEGQVRRCRDWAAAREQMIKMHWLAENAVDRCREN